MVDMDRTDLKVRGTTGFSFTTSLRPADVNCVIQEVVDRFAYDHRDTVLEHRVTMDDSLRFITVQLILVTDSYAEADDMMQRLCGQIAARFTSSDEASEVDERATELVPA